MEHNRIAELLGIVAFVFVAAAPLWLPLTFLGYTLGRRQINLQLLLFFMAVEAICIAVVAAFLRSPLANP